MRQWWQNIKTYENRPVNQSWVTKSVWLAKFQLNTILLRKKSAVLLDGPQKVKGTIQGGASSLLNSRHGLFLGAQACSSQLLQVAVSDSLMTQFCVKSSLHLQSRIFNDAILCQVLFPQDCNFLRDDTFLCQLKIRDCNFLKDDADLCHCESEYAILVATKNLSDGATYLSLSTWGPSIIRHALQGGSKVWCS